MAAAEYGFFRPWRGRPRVTSPARDDVFVGRNGFRPGAHANRSGTGWRRCVTGCYRPDKALSSPLFADTLFVHISTFRYIQIATRGDGDDNKKRQYSNPVLFFKQLARHMVSHHLEVK